MAASLRVHKVLSTPDDPSRAIADGIEELGLTDAVAAGHVTIVHGSTDRNERGARRTTACAPRIVTNRGFTDMLRIGRQARTRAVQPDTRRDPSDPVPSGTADRHRRPHRPRRQRHRTAHRSRSRSAAARRSSRCEPEAVAINLLYSYVDDRNERRIEAAIERSRVRVPFVRRAAASTRNTNAASPRGSTRGWVRSSSATSRGSSSLVAPSRVVVMQSSGGTISAAAASRRAVNLLLSGPAGGLAAARHVGAEIGQPDLLTFDMGGTSTDVALIGAHPALTDEGRIGPFPVAVPMADIHTIGAGGGSIALHRRGAARCTSDRDRRVQIPGPRVTDSAASSRPSPTRTSCSDESRRRCVWRARWLCTRTAREPRSRRSRSAADVGRRSRTTASSRSQISTWRRRCASFRSNAATIRGSFRSRASVAPVACTCARSPKPSTSRGSSCRRTPACSRRWACSWPTRRAR